MAKKDISKAKSMIEQFMGDFDPEPEATEDTPETTRHEESPASIDPAPAWETRAAETENVVHQLNIDELHPFPEHPFKLYADDQLADMIESIVQFGVMTPIHVRLRIAGGYEILAGHNRTEAARRAGLTTIPALIFDMDDDEAIVWMIDSNLRQREKQLASELAFAYKMKLAVLSRQGARTSSLVGTKLRSDELIAEQAGIAKNTLHRYIALTNLIEPLLRRVDNETIKLYPAVSLSSLTAEQQQQLYAFLGDHKPISMKEADELKRLNQAGELTHPAILRVMAGVASSGGGKIRLDRDQLSPYLPTQMNDDEVLAYIIQALDAFRRQAER